MKKIQIFDPALCCSSGVCGVDVDQALVSFAADAAWAQHNGALVERFNLAQQPLVFVEHAVVKGLLERSGESALPVTLVDGELALAGRYPTRDELTRWLADKGQSATEQPAMEQAEPASSGGGCGGRCG